MAFKRSKKKQTDYNIGGKAISDTAIPLYQKNLTRMDDYLSDPTARQDEYMNKYFGADSAQNSDFLRNYQRAMSSVTGNNYSATSGGYSSSGQRAYDDNQRYWNDLGSRLQGNNVTNAYNMANQDYQNMLGANNQYYNAYGLGKAYSDVDQYNDLVDQANSRWYTGIMDALGGAGMASNNPWGMAIGAALKTGGSLLSNDAGEQLDAMNSSGSNNVRGNSGGLNSLAGAFNTGGKGIGQLWDKYGSKKSSSGSSLFSSTNPWTAKVGG